jgi:hypothetical protein
VSRLTLLFFGVAKDIPEAAKTVTAGTVLLHFGLLEHSKRLAKRTTLSSLDITLKEMHRNHRYCWQDMN